MWQLTFPKNSPSHLPIEHTSRNKPPKKNKTSTNVLISNVSRHQWRSCAFHLRRFVSVTTVLYKMLLWRTPKRWTCLCFDVQVNMVGLSNLPFPRSCGTCALSLSQKVMKRNVHGSIYTGMRLLLRGFHSGDAWSPRKTAPPCQNISSSIVGCLR